MSRQMRFQSSKDLIRLEGLHARGDAAGSLIRGNRARRAQDGKSRFVGSVAGGIGGTEQGYAGFPERGGEMQRPAVDADNSARVTPMSPSTDVTLSTLLPRGACSTMACASARSLGAQLITSGKPCRW